MSLPSKIEAFSHSLSTSSCLAAEAWNATDVGAPFSQTDESTEIAETFETSGTSDAFETSLETGDPSEVGSDCDREDKTTAELGQNGLMRFRVWFKNLLACH